MRILAASVLTLSTAISAQAKVERPPQFVALAFDGSRNLDFWKESRDFARKNGIRFTYFISGVYFLANKDRKLYREPRRGRGRSAIGYGGKAADISKRVEQVALAISEGHEIASHANGHYNGSRYSKAQWQLELNQFETIMANSWSRYSDLGEPDWWKSYFSQKVKGFRAPELGRGPSLFKALKAGDYAYDTSRTARPGYWPEKINGIWNFPLANLRIAGTRRGTLSMDYNFYVADSGARRGPSSVHGRYEERMFKTYMNYFNHNYSGSGNRAPIDIGHHFSAWNGGAYWRAMKRFTRTICFKPEVICGTYSELLKFVEDNREHLDDYRRGNFDRKGDPSSLVMAYSTPPAVAGKYTRQEPIAVATLTETFKTAEGSVPVPKTAVRKSRKPVLSAELKKTESRRKVSDAGQRKPNLNELTEAELKAYWTQVWYAKQGKKMPEEEAIALGLRKKQPENAKAKPVKVAKPQPSTVKVAKLESPGAKPKAVAIVRPKPALAKEVKPVSAELPKPTVSKEKKAKKEAAKVKPAVAKTVKPEIAKPVAATTTPPAAKRKVAKLVEPKAKTKRVKAFKPAPAAPAALELARLQVTPKSQRVSGVKYDAGLRRPNLAALSNADREAYWTKVWYARRQQRQVRKR